MPAEPDLIPLGRLVAATHGWPAAKAFKAYDWSEADQAIIANCTNGLLRIFPQDGASALLTAALAVQLERNLAAPIHLVAGSLEVAGTPFRDDSTEDERGHLWIMAGPHIIDVGMFRFARTAACPPEAARHLFMTFGPDKALYADNWRRAQRLRLDYQPRRVLSRAQVDALMAEAYRIMSDA